MMTRYGPLFGSGGGSRLISSAWRITLRRLYGPSTRPLKDFLGRNNDEVIELYAGSGGGTGIDLAWVALDAISYVRISNPGDPQTTPAIEVDATADVAPLTNPADINGDGTVGIGDFLLLLAAWGPCPEPPRPCPADLDGDGIVGIGDMLILFGAWGS